MVLTARSDMQENTSKNKRQRRSNVRPCAARSGLTTAPPGLVGALFMKLRSLPYYVKAIREPKAVDFAEIWWPKFKKKYGDKAFVDTAREGCYMIIAVPKNRKVNIEMRFAYYPDGDTVFVRGTTKFDRNGLTFLIENLL